MSDSAFTLELIGQLSELYHKDSLAELMDFLRGELRILEFIDSVGGDELPPGQIASSLCMSGPRVAAALGTLERKSYIVRRPDLADRRRTLVSLTEKGKQYIDKRREMAYAYVSGTIDKLGTEDSQSLLRLMSRLNEIL